jgi:hypothetical protein
LLEIVTPPPPPITVLVQTMTIGPQTNIVNGEVVGGGGNLGNFRLSLRINFHDCKSAEVFQIS